ncbi:MAG: hypothetical protein QXW82_04335 [Candidatus Bathyarchaeia archaeon]
MEKVKKYKSIFALTTLTFLVTSLNSKLLTLLSFLNNLGVIAFLGGVFYSYTVTAPVSLLFFNLLDENSIAFALIAASGSLIADYVIFRFIKDKLVFEIEAFMRDELKRDIVGGLRKVYDALQQSKLGKVIIIPAIASIIIASPLPDELGIAMLASFRMDDRAFVIISWMLNFLGIAIILGVLKLVI